MVSPEPGVDGRPTWRPSRVCRALELELIAPGHGPLITDPAAKLDQYVAHRVERERQVLAALAEGLRDRDELLDRVWPAVSAELRPGAAATLAADARQAGRRGAPPAA